MWNSKHTAHTLSTGVTEKEETCRVLRGKKELLVMGGEDTCHIKVLTWHDFLQKRGGQRRIHWKYEVNWMKSSHSSRKWILKHTFRSAAHTYYRTHLQCLAWIDVLNTHLAAALPEYGGWGQKSDPDEGSASEIFSCRLLVARWHSDMAPSYPAQLSDSTRRMSKPRVTLCWLQTNFSLSPEFYISDVQQMLTYPGRLILKTPEILLLRLLLRKISQMRI